MPISISCQKCQAKFKVKDALSGKRIACPKCQGTISVPQTESVVEPEVTPAQPLQGNFSDWDLSSLSSSTGSEFQSDNDPFGLPNIDLPTATSFPVAVPVTKQTTNRQTTKPKPSTLPSTSSGVRKSTLLIAGGVGLITMFFVVGMGSLVIWMLTGADKTSVIAKVNETQAEQLAETPVEKPTVEPVTDKAPSSAAQNTTKQPVQNTSKQTTQNVVDAKPLTHRPIKTPDGNYDLEALKAATVLVKMAGTTESQTGSGFLISTNFSEGLIITSAGISVPANETANEIKCVFYSGTPQEFEVAAAVVGKDEALDLAILKIQHNNLPPGIPIENSFAPMEKMLVVAYGFPTKADKSSSGKNPVVTTTKAVITDLKKDEYRMPQMFQVTRPFNLGNSGGPVFNEIGHLLGFTVSKKAYDDNQENVIPRTALLDSLAGRVLCVNKTKTSNDTKKSTYTLQLELLDPCDQIESVDIYSYSLADQTVKKPNGQGKWDLASPKVLGTTNCQIQARIASATCNVAEGVGEMMLQYRVKRKGGTEWMSEPIPLNKNIEETTYISTAIRKKVKGNSPSSQGSDANAETISVKLPSEMADFAMNPRTGDIAGVDPLSNEALLFRATDYAAPAATVPRVSVGITPIAIQYKKFGDSEYYVVVCTQDNSMYLIDTNDFSLVKKIPLTGQGFSEVSVSKNEKDPFIYYCYGGGNECSAGVVDLRKMTSIPGVLNETMDCDLSADGTIAYRRGPYSPSGFISMSLSNSFDDDKPVFTDLFRDHEPAERYFADYHGEYTASGNVIYTKNLTSKVATLDFVPMCFLKSKPIILGLDKWVIRAASYNSLISYEQGFKIPFTESTTKETQLARGINGSSDFKITGYRTKLLSDEVNGRVVVARRDALFIVPLSSFGIPDEPVLAVDVSPSELRVGSTQKITVKPHTEGIDITINNLPEGASAIENGFEWAPTDAQVGKTRVSSTLKFGATKRTIDHFFNVTQPQLSSPIAISKFVYDEAEDVAVCWSNDGLDSYRNRSRDAVTKASARIAVIPFKRGETTQTLEHTEPIKSVVPFGSRIAVLYANDQTKVDIYERPEMKRIKTLVAENPIADVQVNKETLLLMTGSKSEAYQLTSLKRVKSPEPENDNVVARRNELKDGIVSNGLFMDSEKNTPKLMLTSLNLPALEAGEPRLYSGEFLRRVTPQNDINRSQFENSYNEPEQNATRVQGPLPLPQKPFRVELITYTKVVKKQSQRDSDELRFVIALNLISDATKKKERISIAEIPARQNTDRPKPSMQILSDSVIVACENKLYRWKIQLPEQAEENGEKATEEFYIDPQQSAFVIKGNKQTLKHVMHGGKAPFEFVAFRPVSGVAIDETSGNVTIDIDEVAEASKRILSGGRSLSAQEINEKINELQNSSNKYAELVTKNFKTKLQGFPVAVPIHFKAVDSEGHVAEMQYFVIVDISVRQIRKVLQQK